jgi:hypothetical protein
MEVTRAKRVIVVTNEDSQVWKEILAQSRTEEAYKHLVVLGRNSIQIDILKAKQVYKDFPDAAILIDPWVATSRDFEGAGTIFIAPSSNATADEIEQIVRRWNESAEIRGGVGKYAIDIRLTLDKDSKEHQRFMERRKSS